MAGHSQFKNIMHRKGAQDKKRAKIFTKLIREITTAARNGSPEPDKNPRLRAALTAARNANMPKDTIERAIKRGAGLLDDTTYDEIRYEGYGPGGVALIVEGLTDNRTRTASEIRSIFTKGGGNMGEPNSVSFMFEKTGTIFYPLSVGSDDAVLEAAVEAGASDVESDESGHTILTSPDDLGAVRDALEKKFGAPESAKFSWKPLNTIQVGEEHAQELLALIETLEDNDDVQQVFANFDIDAKLMEKLSAA